MSDPIVVKFKKDVNYFELNSDLEKILSVIVNKLAIDVNQSDYSSLTITGENQNTNGIAAYSAIKLDPGIWLKIKSTDFNFDTGTVDRLTGGLEASTLPLTVIASADLEPGIIVRRDTSGNFTGNIITANSLALVSNVDESPNITVDGTSLFDSSGNIIMNTKGTADNAKNVTETIGSVAISDILSKNVADEYISTIKNSANVVSTIKGIDIASTDNEDDSLGILKIGENSNGSDTYAKRALVANKALSLSSDGSTTINVNNLARLDVGNIFASGTTNTFSTIASTTISTTIANVNSLTFNDSPVSVKPSTATFYVAPDTSSTYAPTGTLNLNFNGYLTATKMYNATYGDYAECFIPSTYINYNDAKNKIVQVNEQGEVEIANYMSKTVVGIVSDNYAYLLNGTEADVKNNKKIPVGLAGTLWVKADVGIEKAQLGDFIYSGYDGLAAPIKITSIESLIKYMGAIVGKIIEIDKINNKYKVLLMLK